ncbi:MAG: RNA methyltransferase [Candidatus Eremiobacteraeota bacterium]|nr:RNA methyltransferase [Candidatus Eremiobacteraeota bacterium]
MPLPATLVRTLLKKKGRREHGLFLLEGASLLEEALASGLELREIRVSPAGRASPVVTRAETAGIPVVDETARALERLSDLETPPGIVAVAPTKLQPLAHVLAPAGLVLLLAGVADPGNAGTLVRAAEAFGASGVVFADSGVEPYNPKVVRAAMGSLFRLPHALASASEIIAGANAAHRRIVAADPDGAPLDEFTFPDRPIVAIGSERHGVASWLPGWYASAAIPHAGPTESLNAGVAGAIVLYEWSVRQRARLQK